MKLHDKVAVCDINEEAVLQRAKDIEDKGMPCLGVRCDVSSVESVQQMFAEVVENFGTVDILVNNVALIPTQPADTERRNRQSIGITTSLTDDDCFAGGASTSGGAYLPAEFPKKLTRSCSLAVGDHCLAD
jgi:NAD(P)-dependent dehydrogenase (short-subunit alcohol dehydrogenase family)